MIDPMHPIFEDVPQVTSWGNYNVSVSWDFLEQHLEQLREAYGLDLDPDFQRGHVWSDFQRSRYVEWVLRGGKTGREIIFNCPGFNNRLNVPKTMTLIDGKQRLNAVLHFLHSDVTAFGYYREQYEDKSDLIDARFTVYINDLETREEILQFYLDYNTGGSIHTEDEIERVKKLLEKERNSKCRP